MIVLSRRIKVEGKWVENVRRIRPRRSEDIKLPEGVHVVKELPADILHKNIHKLALSLIHI